MAGTYKILKNIGKWLASIIVVLLTILFILQVIILVHFDKIVEDAIKETVKDSTDDLYSIEFEKLVINVFTGSVSSENVKLVPDTILYQRLKQIGKAPSLLFTINIPAIKISRINVYSAYFEKHLQVRKILITSPEIRILNEPANKAEEKGRKDPLDLYPLISSVLKKAEADIIEIDDGSIFFKKVNKKDPFKYSLAKLSLKFENVLIDTLAFSDTTNFFYSEDIQVVLNDHLIKLPGDYYSLKAGRTSLSTKRSSIKLENLTLRPLHSKLSFGKVYGKQVDRLKIDVKEFNFKKVDLREFLDNQNLIVDELVISDVDISAFRDKRIPFDEKRRPKTIQELLKTFEQNLNISKVRIRNLNVKYEELPESGGPSGIVTFNNIYARITDINNSPEAIKKGQIIWATAQGYLMGKGFISAKFKFPLNDPMGTYYYWGYLENMSFKDMNSMLKPIAAVEITDGKIKKMIFDVTADKKKAVGTLKMYYNGLKVQLKDKDGQVGLKEKLGSFIANNFFVESDNPKNGEFRTGRIDFERDHSRFVFNYWWKSILSGVKPSIGIDESKQESIKQFNIKRQERKKKKQERKQSKKKKNLAKKQDQN